MAIAAVSKRASAARSAAGPVGRRESGCTDLPYLGMQGPP